MRASWCLKPRRDANGNAEATMYAPKIDLDLAHCRDTLYDTSLPFHRAVRTWRPMSKFYRSCRGCRGNRASFVN